MIKGFNLAVAPDGNEYLQCRTCGGYQTAGETLAHRDVFDTAVLLRCYNCGRRHINHLDYIIMEGGIPCESNQ